MRHRQLRPGYSGRRRAIGLVFLAALGCSPQEELKPDPGVSPFYPGPSAEAKATGGGPAITGEPVARGRPAPIVGADPDRSTAAGATDPRAPLRPQDVERELRLALRSIEKGDLARATALLDRILALEPIHREALGGRATVELTRSMKAASPEERLAAIESAAKFVKALRRAYERSNQREVELIARVNYEEVRANVALGRLDRAVALLKEVHESGFDPFAAVEHDPDLAKLKAFKGYEDLVKGIEAENLARARARLKDEFANTPNYRFDFDIKDLDGRPHSLAQLKGKVVLIDFWGTWCKPCRETIPALIRFYSKHRGRGLEIIGLDYEQNAPDEATALKAVKQFVKDAAIPYPIAMGEEELKDKVPNLQGFPTTLLIDRTGKVRLQLTGGGPDALAIIEAGIEVLLAEPESGPSITKAAEKPAGDAKAAAPGAASPPPAQPKDSPRKK